MELIGLICAVKKKCCDGYIGRLLASLSSGTALTVTERLLAGKTTHANIISRLNVAFSCNAQIKYGIYFLFYVTYKLHITSNNIKI